MSPVELFTVDDIAEPLGEENSSIHRQFQLLTALEAVMITDVREHRPEHPVGKIPDHYRRINPPFWEVARHLVRYAADTYPET